VCNDQLIQLNSEGLVDKLFFSEHFFFLDNLENAGDYLTSFYMKRLPTIVSGDAMLSRLRKGS
jgi:hypothetical protein